MIKRSAFLSAKRTATFDSFTVNKPTACWSVVCCYQLHTDTVNTSEFITSVVYVFKYVCHVRMYSNTKNYPFTAPLRKPVQMLHCVLQ